MKHIKKTITVFLSCAICFQASQACYANSTNDVEKAPEMDSINLEQDFTLESGEKVSSKMIALNDEYSSIIDNLDESEYGGLYLDGDVLHIKPVESNSTKREINGLNEKKLSSSNNINIVIDDVAKYTYKELEEAKDKVFDAADDLEIVSAGISNKNNAIVIGAEDWNEEKKEAVIKTAGIENVIFETQEIQNSDSDNTKDTKYNLSSNYNAKATYDIYVGDDIENSSMSGATAHSTLGACAIIDGKEGYITSGHYNEIGDIFYSYSRRLGVVSKVNYGGSVDAAFIEKDSSSKYPLTDDLRLSNSLTRTGRLTTSGRPVLEGAVICWGFGSGYRVAIVEDTSYSWKINGTRFKNLIRTDLGSEPGDSGGPVVIYKGNDRYSLVGIWKGDDGYGHGIATRWDSIEDLWDAELY